MKYAHVNERGQRGPAAAQALLEEPGKLSPQVLGRLRGCVPRRQHNRFSEQRPFFFRSRLWKPRRHLDGFGQLTLLKDLFHLNFRASGQPGSLQHDRV